MSEQEILPNLGSNYEAPIWSFMFHQWNFTRSSFWREIKFTMGKEVNLAIFLFYSRHEIVLRMQVQPLCWGPPWLWTIFRISKLTIIIFFYWYCKKNSSIKNLYFLFLYIIKSSCPGCCTWSSCRYSIWNRAVYRTYFLVFVRTCSR